MSRLAKKCFIGSTLAHGLLGVVLIVGLAFKRSDVVVESVPGAVTMFPVTLIDGKSHGGNVSITSPPAESRSVAKAVAQPPPPAPTPTPTPTPARSEEVEPPRPQPKIVETAPAPLKEERPSLDNGDFQETKPRKTAQKPAPKQYDFKPSNSTASKSKTASSKEQFTFKEIRPSGSRTTSTASKSTASSASSQQSERWNKFAQKIGSAGSGIRSSTASGTTIEMPGAGGGGAAAVNYAEFVKAIYDDAWRDPQDVADESATVRTEIIIRRDGTIVSSRIVNRSGVRGLDNSVQEVINRVRSVRPFPAGATDSQRTFILKFNLKSKRSLG